MFEDQIIRTVEAVFKAQRTITENFAHTLVQELCYTAVNNSLDESYHGPFSINARRAGQIYIGGKPDDTTVIVSIALKI
jgi:hypothetical protein